MQNSSFQFSTAFRPIQNKSRRLKEIPLSAVEQDLLRYTFLQIANKSPGIIKVSGDEGTGKSFILGKIYKFSVRSKLQSLWFNNEIGFKQLDKMQSQDAKSNFSVIIIDDLLDLNDLETYYRHRKCKSLFKRSLLIVACDDESNAVINCIYEQLDIKCRNFVLSPLYSSRQRSRTVVEKAFADFRRLGIINQQSQAYLENYAWPQNYKNIIRLSILLDLYSQLGHNQTLNLQQLEYFCHDFNHAFANLIIKDLDYNHGLEEFVNASGLKTSINLLEHYLILEYVDKNNQVVSQAARQLRIPISTLHSKISGLNLTSRV